MILSALKSYGIVHFDREQKHVYQLYHSRYLYTIMSSLLVLNYFVLNYLFKLFKLQTTTFYTSTPYQMLVPVCSDTNGFL